MYVKGFPQYAKRFFGLNVEETLVSLLDIREFQRMMRRIYFHRDSKRGVKKTYMWLVEEVGELGEAIKTGDERQIRDEVADVIAWLASLANLLGVDVEEAALSKYPGRCPKCGMERCVCKHELSK